jgi:hypothetical protein
MAIRREVLLIIALLVLIAVLVKVIEFFKPEIVEADARAFVSEELATKYPSADIEIMSVTPRYNQYEDKYFELKAKVTEYFDTPCPERSHIYYLYPVQNFVAQPADVITASCEVCTEGICVIAFEEEAVIASHTFPGTETVHSYVTTYTDATPQVIEDQDTWYVMWDSKNSKRYYTVNMRRDGTLLNVTKTVKD